jgi:hypothetical protein
MILSTYNELISSNPIPDNKELVFEKDKNRFKIGDGVQKYIKLEYINDQQSFQDAIVEVFKYMQENETEIFNQFEGGSETAGSIKTKYESNEDTNAFTDDEKTKLAALDPDARTAQFVEVTKSHTDFQVAATSNDIEIYSLPAGWSINKVLVKHTIAFEASTAPPYNISTGIAGNLNKFSPNFNVAQAVDDTTHQENVLGMNVENWGSVTSIRARATKAGADLDTSTAGSVTFYLEVQRIK